MGVGYDVIDELPMIIIQSGINLSEVGV